MGVTCFPVFISVARERYLVINNKGITCHGIVMVLSFNTGIAIITRSVYRTLEALVTSSETGGNDFNLSTTGGRNDRIRSSTTSEVAVVGEGFGRGSYSNVRVIVTTASSGTLGRRVTRCYGTGSVVMGTISRGTSYDFVFPSCVGRGGLITTFSDKKGDPILARCLGNGRRRVLAPFLNRLGRCVKRVHREMVTRCSARTREGHMFGRVLYTTVSGKEVPRV